MYIILCLYHKTTEKSLEKKHILFLSNSDRLVTNLARMCFYFRFRKKQIISSLLKHWVLNRPFNFRWVLSLSKK